jgi:hypothetical protein
LQHLIVRKRVSPAADDTEEVAVGPTQLGHLVQLLRHRIIEPTGRAAEPLDGLMDFLSDRRLGLGHDPSTAAASRRRRGSGPAELKRESARGVAEGDEAGGDDAGASDQQKAQHDIVGIDGHGHLIQGNAACGSQVTWLVTIQLAPRMAVKATAMMKNRTISRATAGA